MCLGYLLSRNYFELLVLISPFCRRGDRDRRKPSHLSVATCLLSSEARI